MVATGPCPTFTTGLRSFTFGGQTRDVEIFASDRAAVVDGPLIFVWQGGVIAAPYHDPAQTELPWHLTTGTGADDDLRLADESVGCAEAAVGIDDRRIHSIGFSAGALHSAQMAWRRASYLSSVVLYSGGILGAPPADQQPDNRFAALIFHGGPTDTAFTTSFEVTSEAFRDALVEQGRFGLICDHGTGHRPPAEGGATAWLFFEAHPWATSPSPWAATLSVGVPAYCTP